MIKVFLVTVFIIVATVVTLNNFGYSPKKIKSFLVVGNSPTPTPSTTLIKESFDVVLKKYNINQFKNTKWGGEIFEKVNGSIPTYLSPIVISMNSTIKIDELSIDFDNLDWNNKAKSLRISNTNTNGGAISIIGKGTIIYQNPWKTFVSTATKLNIENNPIPISFVGYIDPINKQLMFNEAFTNKPMVKGTEHTCLPDPIGCLPSITKNWELKAQDLWLRGMTYEFGQNSEIILKEPIWDLQQKEYLQKSLEAATQHKGNVKVEANGYLKRKNY